MHCLHLDGQQSVGLGVMWQASSSGSPSCCWTLAVATWQMARVEQKGESPVASAELVSRLLGTPLALLTLTLDT